MFAPASKSRLTPYDLGRFPGDTLFDRLGRAVCRAGCLPRKELFEAWQVARRVRRTFRGGRVVDLAGGHGLLAHVLLLLDDSSPGALVVDTVIPPSAAALRDALCESWPRLAGRVAFEAGTIEDTALQQDDVVVSCHACGPLTDAVLDRATAARARVAVMPCCHDAATCATGPLAGWMDGALAIDAVRALRLESCGYRVRTQTIPDAVTPKNRLLLGEPT
ncbi:MAG: methyltransferase [Vicinamibacterales bacterium]